MAESIINRIIRVGNRDVILIMDDINRKTIGDNRLVIGGSVDSDYYATVDVNELDELKDDHPKIKIYGFWSSLLNSEVIDKNGLQYFDIGEDSGYYIYVKDSRILETGVFENNYIPSNHNIKLSEAKKIEINYKDIEIPDEHIRSAVDSYREVQERKAEITKGLVRGSFLAGLLLTGMTFFLNEMESISFRDMEKNTSMVSSLDRALDNLRGSKMLIKHNQENDLLALFNLNNSSGGDLFIKRQPFNALNRTAIMDAELPNPRSVLLDSMNIKSYDKQKGWVIQW